MQILEDIKQSLKQTGLSVTSDTEVLDIISCLGTEEDTALRTKLAVDICLNADADTLKMMIIHPDGLPQGLHYELIKHALESDQGYDVAAKFIQNGETCRQFLHQFCEMLNNFEISNPEFNMDKLLNQAKNPSNKTFYYDRLKTLEHHANEFRDMRNKYKGEPSDAVMESCRQSFAAFACCFAICDYTGKNSKFYGDEVRLMSVIDDSIAKRQLNLLYMHVLYRMVLDLPKRIASTEVKQKIYSKVGAMGDPEFDAAIGKSILMDRKLDVVRNMPSLAL